jgi:hypothetical protein
MIGGFFWGELMWYKGKERYAKKGKILQDDGTIEKD